MAFTQCQVGRETVRFTIRAGIKWHIVIKYTMPGLHNDAVSATDMLQSRGASLYMTIGSIALLCAVLVGAIFRASRVPTHVELRELTLLHLHPVTTRARSKARERSSLCAASRRVPVTIYASFCFVITGVSPLPSPLLEHLSTG